MGIVSESFAAALVFGFVRYMAGVVLAIVSVYFGVRLFDRLTTGIDEVEELKKNNVAVGIMVAAVIISFAAAMQGGVDRFTSGIQAYYAPSLLIALAVINFIKLGVGVALSVLTIYISFNFLDRLTKHIDETEHLKKGNVGMAILIAGVLIAVALVMNGTMVHLMDSPGMESCNVAVMLQQKGAPITVDGCLVEPASVNVTMNGG